jgi:hypothetical protein
MASTYTVPSTTPTEAPWANKVKTIEVEVDSTLTGTYGTSGIAQNETITMFQFPAGSIILAVQMLVTTAQTTVTDVDVGISTDGSTDDSLLDGVSLASEAYVGVTIAAPVYCNAANYLVVTNQDATAITTGKFNVIVTYIDSRSFLA